MKTTKEDVIDWIISQDLIPKLSYKYINGTRNNREDFVQDLYEIVLNIDEDKLIKLFDNGDIVKYINKIAYNQALYPKSNFNTLYQSCGLPNVPL